VDGLNRYCGKLAEKAVKKREDEIPWTFSLQSP
jgi:hypothetical protein